MSSRDDFNAWIKKQWLEAANTNTSSQPKQNDKIQKK